MRGAYRSGRVDRDPCWDVSATPAVHRQPFVFWAGQPPGDFFVPSVVGDRKWPRINTLSRHFFLARASTFSYASTSLRSLVGDAGISLPVRLAVRCEMDTVRIAQGDIVKPGGSQKVPPSSRISPSAVTTLGGRRYLVFGSGGRPRAECLASPGTPTHRTSGIIHSPRSTTSEAFP